MSTIMFADYAKFIDGKFIPVIYQMKILLMQKNLRHKFNKFINYYVDDSVNFLNNFNQKIDFLYLDSYDGHDPVKASETSTQ